MEQFSHVKLYLIFFFSFFLYKKQVATLHHLLKKRGALKKHPKISFLRAP